MSIFHIGKDATSPTYQTTLTDQNGDPIDLTGATVSFIMYRRAGTEKVNRAATISDATNGVVQHTWQAADTDTAGVYRVKVKVVYSDSSIEYFPTPGFQKVRVSV